MKLQISYMLINSHNEPNSKLKTPTNESTSTDVEAEFAKDVCFNNLLDDKNSLNFVNSMSAVRELDRNFIQHALEDAFYRCLVALF